MANGKQSLNRTRTVNPKLGFLGFLGFAGFLGIGGYQATQDVTAFVFFAFFGFFGFFFEGKMSNLLMDERYLENRKKAELTAYRLGFRVTLLALVASSWGWLFPTQASARIFLTVVLSLTCGGVIFLAEYLLYRYDQEDGEE